MGDTPQDPGKPVLVEEDKFFGSLAADLFVKKPLKLLSATVHLEKNGHGLFGLPGRRRHEKVKRGGGIPHAPRGIQERDHPERVVADNRSATHSPAKEETNSGKDGQRLFGEEGQGKVAILPNERCPVAQDGEARKKGHLRLLFRREVGTDEGIGRPGRGQGRSAGRVDKRDGVAGPLLGNEVVIHHQAGHPLPQKHPKDIGTRCPHVADDDPPESLLLEGSDPGGKERSAVLAIGKKNGMGMMAETKEAGEDGGGGETVNIKIRIDEHRLSGREKVMKPRPGFCHLPQGVVSRRTRRSNIPFIRSFVDSSAKENPNPDRIEPPCPREGIDAGFVCILNIPVTNRLTARRCVHHRNSPAMWKRGGRSSDRPPGHTSDDILLLEVKNDENRHRRQHKKADASKNLRNVDTTLHQTVPFPKTRLTGQTPFFSGAGFRGANPNPFLRPGRISRRGLATKMEA
jgi:hypothetical protein